MEQYRIGEYSTPQEFFALLAKRQGKFKKGGIIDTAAAARGLIDDWNRYEVNSERQSLRIDLTST